MIERVAAALAEQFKQTIEQASGMTFAESGVKLPGDDVWLGYARAAIEAMREPTFEMRGAAQQHFIQRGGKIVDMWEPMIDAALNPERKP